MKRIMITACVFVLACIGTGLPSKAVAGTNIRIGVVTSLTGEKALTGQYTKYGIQLLTEEINRQGGLLGKPVEAVYEDDGGTDAGAVNAYNKLVMGGGNIVAVVGPIYSTMDLAMSPAIRKAEVPTMVTGSSMAIGKQKNPWMFQSRTSDAISAVAIAKYGVQSLNMKKIGIIHDSDAYGQGASEAAIKALEELKVTPVAVTAYNTGDKDFTPQLVKIKAAGADGIMAFSLQTEAGLIMKQIKTLGIGVPVIGSTSYGSKIAIDLARDAAENVYSLTDYVPTTPLAKGQEFAKKYKEKYKIESDFAGAISHDAFLIIAEGIRRAHNTEKKDVRQVIASLKEFEGASNIFTFDENNVGGTGILLVHIKAGQPQLLKAIRGR